LFEPNGDLRALSEARRLATDEFEQRYLEEALARGHGRLVEAAELSGVSRRFISRLVSKHGLKGHHESDE
jgi:DNA-binding NtrC family response regulator